MARENEVSKIFILSLNLGIGRELGREAVSIQAERHQMIDVRKQMLKRGNCIGFHSNCCSVECMRTHGNGIESNLFKNEQFYETILYKQQENPPIRS